MRKVPKLTKLVRTLILTGCKAAGSYNPDVVLPRIEEMLTSDEYAAIDAFLRHVYITRSGFGATTLVARWSKFHAS